MRLTLPGLLACSMTVVAGLGCSAASSGPGVFDGGGNGSSPDAGNANGSSEDASNADSSSQDASNANGSSPDAGSTSEEGGEEASTSSGGDGSSGTDAGSHFGDASGPLDAGTPGDAGACGPTGAGPAFADTATQNATNFSDGTIAPFSVCTTASPGYGKAAVLNGDPAMEFFWAQTGYDGTRDRRGAEACSNLQFYKEGWYGFQFYLPTPGFPTDKTEGIGQLFSLGGCSSWTGMLQVHNNSLWLYYRDACVDPVEVQLAADIARNVWNPIIIHFVASHEKAGTIEIWYGNAVCAQSAPTYSKTGISLGFGTWDGDTLASTASNYIGLKFGMYNFDDGNYTPGETRTIYYDNVSQLVGTASNAWAMVNPTQ